MSFAADLLREIDDAKAFQDWRTGKKAPTEQASPSCHVRELAVLRAETLRIGTFASMATAICNRRMSDARSSPPLEIIPAFCPRPSSTTLTTLQDIVGCSDHFRLVQLWESLDAQMRFAMQLSSAVGGDAHTLSGSKFVSIEAVADCWRRVCIRAIATLKEIATEMAHRDCAVADDSETRVIALLKSAVAGETPCIDDTGQLDIPGVAERRSVIRQATHQRVSMVIGGAIIPAQLADVSSAGAGLIVPIAVDTGKQIGIKLDGMPAIPAVVAWSSNGRLGVTFELPLSPESLLRMRQN